ncbi:MAG: signal peptidase I [Nocardioides sp.]
MTARLALLCAVLLALSLVTGVLRLVSVTSTSMMPTLCPGARGLAWTLGAGGLADRGDVVTVREPAGPRVLVKRVVAVAGDTVEVYDGRLLVNRLPQTEEYVDLEAVNGTFFGPVDVATGTVFVMGDEREHSVDSRDFGPLPQEQVTGIVLVRGGGECRVR